MYCSSTATKNGYYSRPANLYTFHVEDLHFKMGICWYLPKRSLIFSNKNGRWANRHMNLEWLTALSDVLKSPILTNTPTFFFQQFFLTCFVSYSLMCFYCPQLTVLQLNYTSSRHQMHQLSYDVWFYKISIVEIHKKVLKHSQTKSFTYSLSLKMEQMWV